MVGDLPLLCRNFMRVCDQMHAAMVNVPGVCTICEPRADLSFTIGLQVKWDQYVLE